MKVKAGIFDRDGVLVNSEGIHIQSIDAAFRAYNCSLPEEEKGNVVGRYPDEYIPELIEKYHVDALPDEIRKIQQDTFHELWETISEPMPFVREALSVLYEKNIALILATNSGIRATEEFLQKNDLRQYFSFLVTKEDVHKKKPDPEIYLLAKERSGFSSSEILVIEDCAIGVQAAVRAGLRCIAVPNEYTQHQDFSEADRVLGSLEHLSDYISS